MFVPPGHGAGLSVCYRYKRTALGASAWTGQRPQSALRGASPRRRGGALHTRLRLVPRRRTEAAPDVGASRPLDRATVVTPRLPRRERRKETPDEDEGEDDGLFETQADGTRRCRCGRTGRHRQRHPARPSKGATADALSHHRGAGATQRGQVHGREPHGRRVQDRRGGGRRAGRDPRSHVSPVRTQRPLLPGGGHRRAVVRRRPAERVPAADSRTGAGGDARGVRRGAGGGWPGGRASDRLGGGQLSAARVPRRHRRIVAAAGRRGGEQVRERPLRRCAGGGVLAARSGRADTRQRHPRRRRGRGAGPTVRGDTRSAATEDGRERALDTGRAAGRPGGGHSERGHHRSTERRQIQPPQPLFGERAGDRERGAGHHPRRRRRAAGGDRPAHRRRVRLSVDRHRRHPP
eukprot:ctg_1134.g467